MQDSIAEITGPVALVELVTDAAGATSAVIACWLRDRAGNQEPSLVAVDALRRIIPVAFSSLERTAPWISRSHQ